MNNILLQIKIKERLNKLASMDYDNIECWQIVEAFNKAQLEWVRRQFNGVNIQKEGDESSILKMDDLQKLLTEETVTTVHHAKYDETALLPANYLYFKRLSCTSHTDCCSDRSMIVYLAAVADVDNLLVDILRNPSPEWGETFCTFQGNKFRIYTNGKFGVTNAVLTYYRLPRPISFSGCVDIATGNPSSDVECEFKDDIAEIIIDETVAILAGDIESLNVYNTAKTNTNTNT
jgi:hypothetical protein